MSNIPAWAVSAAILLDENQVLSTRILVNKVLETRLSDLGMRGGKSPERTLPVQLKQKATPIPFDVIDGQISLGNRKAAIENPKVRTALTILRNRMIGSPEVNELKQELRELLACPQTPDSLKLIRRVIQAYERPKSITDYVKRTRQPIATCQLCHTLGFVKRDGERYCEVHHLFHLSKQPPADCLAPEYLVVLCASCHKRMHYANVGEPERDGDSWRVAIDQQEYRFITE